MSTPQIEVPAQRDRWHAPKQFPRQLIIMATDEMGDFVEAYASLRGVSKAAVLRDLVQAGIDALDPGSRALVEMSTRDDGWSKEVTEEGGR
jgi:hypothetical protein